MGRKEEKNKKNKDKQVPTPRATGPKRKACKTPRGVKLEKYKDRLLMTTTDPRPKHQFSRNDYNHRMAAAAKFARML